MGRQIAKNRVGQWLAGQGHQQAAAAALGWRLLRHQLRRQIKIKVVYMHGAVNLLSTKHGL